MFSQFRSFAQNTFRKMTRICAFHWSLLADLLTDLDLLQLALTSHLAHRHYYHGLAARIFWKIDSLASLTPKSRQHVRKVEIDKVIKDWSQICLQIREVKLHLFNDWTSVLFDNFHNMTTLHILRGEIETWELDTLDMKFSKLVELVVDNPNVHVTHFPATLTRLVYHGGSSLTTVFPHNLTSLTLGEHFQPALSPGLLPPGLEFLSLGGIFGYRHKLEPGVIPSSLKHLVLFCCQSLISVGAIPSSVVIMELGNTSEDPSQLEPGILGKTLRYLKYSGFVCCNLDALPVSLTELDIQIAGVISGRGFPKGLTTITLGCHNIVLESLLVPCNLRALNIRNIDIATSISFDEMLFVQQSVETLILPYGDDYERLRVENLCNLPNRRGLRRWHNLKRLGLYVQPLSFAIIPESSIRETFGILRKLCDDPLVTRFLVDFGNGQSKQMTEDGRIVDWRGIHHFIDLHNSKK
jgi:hypothetical protein